MALDEKESWAVIKLPYKCSRSLLRPEGVEAGQDSWVGVDEPPLVSCAKPLLGNFLKGL